MDLRVKVHTPRYATTYIKLIIGRHLVLCNNLIPNRHYVDTTMSTHDTLLAL